METFLWVIGGLLVCALVGVIVWAVEARIMKRRAANACRMLNAYWVSYRNMNLDLSAEEVAKIRDAREILVCNNPDHPFQDVDDKVAAWVDDVIKHNPPTVTAAQRIPTEHIAVGMPPLWRRQQLN
jgi:hypothetical protein